MNINRALYEIKRESLLTAFINAPEKGRYDFSYIYAYESRMCPLFHLGHYSDDNQQDPFDDSYSTPENIVSMVIKFCDDEWGAKRKVTFYNLEDKLKVGRADLICILRYAYLNNRFDGAFYKDIESNCPCEAHGLTRPFDETSISLY